MSAWVSLDLAVTPSNYTSHSQISRFLSSSSYIPVLGSSWMLPVYSPCRKSRSELIGEIGSICLKSLFQLFIMASGLTSSQSRRSEVAQSRVLKDSVASKLLKISYILLSCKLKSLHLAKFALSQKFKVQVCLLLQLLLLALSIPLLNIA